MYFLYRIVTAVGMFVLAPYFALRGWRRDERPGALRERLGILPHNIVVSANNRAAEATGSGRDSGAIWVHAVSVGEVLAATPLIEGLKREFPGRAILVSTTTETGQRLARERLKSAEAIFYFPLDWIVPVRKALRTIRPAVVIVMETEIWPNFLRETRCAGIPVVFANARISERSFSRFERWRLLVGEFFARTLQDADLFLAQSEEDARRLAGMGAAEDRVEVTGNMKYDVPPAALGQFGAWLEAQIRQQERWPLLVAGSVVEGEEEAVLAGYDAVQRQWRRTLLILAPRKPDRFAAAEKIAAEAGWNTLRRSQLNLDEVLPENIDVLILDSIGELAGLYSLADAVFVGGSLVRAGGHNILEPACFGRPPVFGTSMENFSEMADQFLDAHAGVQVANGQQLGRVWVELIENNAMRERMGNAARDIAEHNRGATARSLNRIASLIAGDQSASAQPGAKEVNPTGRGEEGSAA
ncbi:MAG: 3-deoxy-D-manno-octulosonic acid transferase [Candidatus Acidiferrales bacterium]